MSKMHKLQRPYSSKTRKPVSNMLSSMYKEHDNFAMDYWVNQAQVDMTDLKAWFNLKSELLKQVSPLFH